MLNVSEFPKKKFLESSKAKKKQRTRKKQATDNTKKILTRTPCKLKKEESCTVKVERRQLSSPAVMFTHLRSNRRYKPGD